MRMKYELKEKYQKLNNYLITNNEKGQEYLIYIYIILGYKI